MEENKTGFTDKYYRLLLILIFAAGILIRLYYYVQNNSFWYDEASLAINVVNGSYKSLFSGLQLMQACPPGFTVSVKFLLDLIHPKNIYIRDLLLRLIPFVCGVASIFAFYRLEECVFKNSKAKILTGLLLFSITPAAILYSVQFKQYSTELLISIILFIIFYKIIFEEKNKWYYLPVIVLSVWFSYSAFFVVAAGLLALFFKNKKMFLLILGFTVLNCLVYYFLSLKDVFSVNYSFMNSYWSEAYSFLHITHPTRILYRTGDMFILIKNISLIAGLVVYIPFLIYWAGKENYIKKVLFTAPVLFAVLASMLHKYPFSCRLILFLLPVFLILLVEVKGKIGLALKIILGSISLISISTYSPDTRDICYSYARDITAYLNHNKKQEEVLIFDSNYNEYLFYFNDYNLKIGNDSIILPAAFYSEDLNPRIEVIEALPKGHYYLLTSIYKAKQIVEQAGLKPVELDLGFKPKKCKAVYFEKN